MPSNEANFFKVAAGNRLSAATNFFTSAAAISAVIPVCTKAWASRKPSPAQTTMTHWPWRFCSSARPPRASCSQPAKAQSASTTTGATLSGDWGWSNCFFMTRTTACASLAGCAATGLCSLDACTGVAKAKPLNRAKVKAEIQRIFCMIERINRLTVRPPYGLQCL